MKKWFLREHLGVCSLEDAKTKGLMTVEQDFLGQLLPIFRKPQKSLPARVLLRTLEWAPYPFSQAPFWEWWRQQLLQQLTPHSLFGPLLTWETGALLALWKISFQSSGGWRADYAGPLLGLRHMETDSTCWGSGLREKRLVQESGWGLGDKAAAAWLTKDGDKRQATCRGLSGGSECLVCPGIHIPFFLHLFSFPVATSCGDSRAKCKVSIPVNSLLSLLCSAFPDSFNN